MRWSSALSTSPRIDEAAGETVARIRASLRDAPDLLIVFVSAEHAANYERVPELIRRTFPRGTLIGCSAGGVIGGGREIEDRPAFSLTAAHLPGVDVVPFHVDSVSDLDALREPLSRLSDPQFVLLPDPFTFEAETFTRALDRLYPTSTKVGGLASGGRQAGGNALYLGTTTHRSGLVGVAVSGDIAVDTIVAQGCRPIGEPMFVTRCDRNILFALDQRPAVDVVQQLYREASHEDQALMRQALFLGIVMREDQQEYRQGDFLVRNVMRMDERGKALAIGELLRPGMVVQFHVRDRKTSADDLESLLSRFAADAGDARPVGSLLFSCLGRGEHLYGRADHDSEAFRRHLGDVPLGGFFCNGEIGPVLGTTFLHGYTSAFGLFRSRRS